MDCCTNTKDLGCYDKCVDLQTTIDIAAGNYTIKYEFNGRVTSQDVVKEEGTGLTLQYSWFNSDYTTTFQIYDEDGGQVSYNFGGAIEYDCFKITTLPIIY